MSEYEQVIDEIVKHGVVVKVNKIVDGNYIPYERKYVGCVVELDFSEHDKVLEDKIAELEKQIKSYETERKELRTRCCMDSAREKFDNHSYGGLVIYTKNFTSECERRLYDENQSLKKRIDELECKNLQLAGGILRKETKIQKLEREEAEKSSEIDTSTPINCANSLISHLTHLEAFLIAPERYERTFDIDDLEQIAEHLLVYCKHNKESE